MNHRHQLRELPRNTLEVELEVVVVAVAVTLRLPLRMRDAEVEGRAPHMVEGTYLDRRDYANIDRV